MIKQIGIGGITRNSSDISCNDGEMEDLLNFRHINGGGIVPTGGYSGELFYPVGTKIVCIHRHSTYEHAILYKESTKELYWYAYKRNEEWVRTGDENNSSDLGVLLYTSTSEVQNVSQLNSYLSILMNDSVEHIVWSGSSYIIVGDIRLNSQEIGINAINHTETITEEITVSFDISEQNHYNLIATEKNKEGYIVHPFLFQFSLRTTNGDIVGHSPIQVFRDRYYSFTNDWLITSFRRPPNESTGSFLVDRFCRYIRLSIPVNIDMRKILHLRQIGIHSIVLSISKPLFHLDESKNIDDSFIKEQLGIGAYQTQYKIKQSVYDKIFSDRLLEVNNLYFIKEIPLSDIEGSNSYDIMGDLREESIVLNEAIPSSYDQYIYNIGKYSFVYNSKEHMWGIKRKLRCWHNLNDYCLSYSDSSEIYCQESTIRCKITYNDGRAITSATNILTSNLDNVISTIQSVFFSVGSKNIQSIRFEFTDELNDPYVLQMNLKNHPYLNISYCINLEGNAIIRGNSLITDLISPTIEYRPNGISVSSVNTPLIYPLDRNLLIGKSSVVGIGVATTTLSNAQFGRFPLYVFTTDGVWALESGDGGDVAYSSIVPVNNHSCINEKMIVGINGGVAYACTEGLMLLQGGESVCISKVLDDRGIFSLGDDRFPEVLKHGVAGYNSSKGELYVSIQGKRYCYVYKFDSGVWSRRDIIDGELITDMITDPESLKVLYKNGDGDGDMIDISKENLVGITHCSFKSRPMKLESLSEKKIERLFLRGFFKGRNIRLTVSGSQDGKNYVELGSLMSGDSDISVRDLKLTIARSGVRYIVISASGDFWCGNTVIDMISTESKESISSGRMR